MKWEYWIAVVDLNDREKALAEAGAQGWELVQADHIPSSHISQYRFYFKRPVAANPSSRMFTSGDIQYVNGVPRA